MRIEKRQKVLAIVTIGVVALMAADRLLISPLTRTWKEHADRISEVSKNLNRGATLLDAEKPIRERWTNMQSNTLPTDVSVAQSRILKSVDRWTKASGISVTSIRPAWKQNADDYTTLECRADAIGDIQSVTRFLYELERDHIPRDTAGKATVSSREPQRDPLALRVEELEIAAHDNTGQQLSLGIRFTGLLLTGEPK
ncbi:MAG: hypothetical protein ACYDH9_08755 [Limisphaerales bacterium]